MGIKSPNFDIWVITTAWWKPLVITVKVDMWMKLSCTDGKKMFGCFLFYFRGNMLFSSLNLSIYLVVIHKMAIFTLIQSFASKSQICLNFCSRPQRWPRITRVVLFSFYLKHNRTILSTKPVNLTYNSWQLPAGHLILKLPVN